MIWKAKIPERIKMFGWRVATGSLPTKVNKFKTTLEKDVIFSICGCTEENDFHAMIECTKARALRADDPLRRWCKKRERPEYSNHAYLVDLETTKAKHYLNNNYDTFVKGRNIELIYSTH